MQQALDGRCSSLLSKRRLVGNPSEQRRLLTFVVVGGGPTGVEMAGALAEVAHQALPGDFRHIDPHATRIVLIEAGPRILPTFPEDLSAYAQDALARMGVEVLTSTRVTGCDENGVELENGRIEASTTVWAAGVVASEAAEWINARRDRANRIEVESDLSVPGRPEIFAIGDTAHVKDETGRNVPGVAPAAKQMGRYVARAIAARASGADAAEPFRYQHQGDLATIGRSAAVVKLDHVKLRGFVGWLFWSVAHVYFLVGVRNRFVVAFSWLWSFVTFQRAARLIIHDRRRPREGASPAIETFGEDR